MELPLPFDHAIVIHDDLGKAVDGLHRLGFRPTPPGYHGDALGTENVTVVLPDQETYFEIMVVRAPNPANADRRRLLASRGRHLFGIALKGAAEEARPLLDRAGMADGEIIRFSRMVELPGGHREASFTIAPMRLDALPALYSFVCEHHSPGVVWRRDYLGHPNTAEALTDVWGVAPDPAALAAPWRQLYGDDVSADADSLTVETGTARIRMLAPTAWQACFPSIPVDRVRPGYHALGFRVRSIDAVREQLEAHDVAFAEAGGSVVVPNSQGVGAAAIFAEAR